MHPTNVVASDMYLNGNQDRLSELYDPAFVRRVEIVGEDGPVQVCLDGRMLDTVAGTGVATYAQVLARCLPRTGAVAAVLDENLGPGNNTRRRVNRWIAAFGAQPRHAKENCVPMADAPATQGWSAPDVFKEAQVFFTLHGRLLPIRCERPPAVMHWTYPVPLYVEGARNIYTVHDLIPLTHPELTTISVERHRRLVSAVSALAARIVTVSETMRTAIEAMSGEAGPPVVNTYQAVDAPLQSDPPLPAGLRSGRYFLFCGTVEPRKNLERLVLAHALSGASQPLVIVGPEARGEDALEARIDAAPNVLRLPWQPRPVLLGLMRRARALLFPSLAEGFGLPIAEAMTLGCPVLTSDCGAPAEISGDAALLVDAFDLSAIAAAIARLGVDDRLCARLRSAGFARARLFSQEAYGNRLRSLYAELLADTNVAECRV